MFKLPFSSPNKAHQLKDYHQGKKFVGSIIPGDNFKIENYVPPILIEGSVDLSMVSLHRQASDGSTSSLSSNPSANSLKHKIRFGKFQIMFHDQNLGSEIANSRFSIKNLIYKFRNQVLVTKANLI